jgi:ubiquitin-like 1-activating enzyme E1 A
MATPTPLSADESAVYDRQLRLWGFKAQEHIRRADVLLVSMRALANEVAKNLVLTGINSLTVVDPARVAAEDLGAQFLLADDDVGKNVRLLSSHICAFDGSEG